MEDNDFRMHTKTNGRPLIHFRPAFIVDEVNGGCNALARPGAFTGKRTPVAWKENAASVSSPSGPAHCLLFGSIGPRALSDGAGICEWTACHHKYMVFEGQIDCHPPNLRSDSDN
jgi:hypothetical protein